MGSQPTIILCGLTWFDWSEWSFRAGFPRNEKNLYIYIYIFAVIGFAHAVPKTMMPLV